MGLFKSISSAVTYINETYTEAAALINKELPSVVSAFDKAVDFTTDTCSTATTYVGEAYTAHLAPSVNSAWDATCVFVAETGTEAMDLIHAHVTPVVAKAANTTLDAVDDVCMKATITIVENLAQRPGITMIANLPVVTKMAAARYSDNLLASQSTADKNQIAQAIGSPVR